MTGHPIPENHGHWWHTTWASWSRLHAIPGAAVTLEEHHEAIDQGAALDRVAACGLRAGFAYAGVLNRFGMPRCRRCCRALNIPPGYGTPCNEASLARREREAAGE